MRLIDADEVVRAVHDEFDECLVWDESGATTANEFENIILQIPTVDAVPVVRCKDCIYRYHDSKRGYMCDMDSLDPYEQTRGVNDGEWYCADGERREDGKTDLRKGID